jgi:hypothetical protein
MKKRTKKSLLWYVLLQNATIECGAAGICGDVNDSGDVNMADVMTLWYDIADYSTSGAYEVNCC